MKITILFALFCFSTLAEDFVFNKDTGEAIPNFVGQLQSFKGQVKKGKGKSLVEAKTGDRFYKNETIMTAKASLARIKIVDDTQLTIGPNSEITLSEFDYKTKTDRSAVYTFLQGQIRSNVVSKAKEKTIFLKTTVATLGVRGTEIVANHRKLGDVEITEFALISGSAEVTDFKKKQYELGAGQRIVISKVGDSVHETRNELSTMDIESLKSEDALLAFSEYTMPQNKDSTATVKELEKTETKEDKTGKKGTFQNLNDLNDYLKKKNQ